jgi:lycopene beta-cyclase
MTTPVIIVGGGLCGGLLAWYLMKRRPHLEFRVYEDKRSFGGNHTWSFHGTDVTPENLELLAPLIRKSWPGYEVAFPGQRRSVPISYHSITADHFDAVLRNELPHDRLRLGTRIAPDEALRDSPIVFDARGVTAWARCGYQKFLGLELETREPHGLQTPVLMDATVEQIDGLRFLYFLPFDERRILIEDTRYSDTSFLDHYRMREHVRDVARARGWEIAAVVREEHGALPIPFSWQKETAESGAVNLGGIFHDTTGYSFPDAVRLVDRLTRSSFELPELRKIVADYRRKRGPDRRFFCLLNRLMFFAGDEASRYRTMAFFYRQGERSISKFYRGDLSHFDRLKFFLGSPPVDVGRALDVIFDKRSIYESAL